MPVWLTALVAFVVSLAGCWLLTRSVILRNISSVAPAEDRWHQHITPGLGGIPIYIAFNFAAIVSGIYSQPTLAIYFAVLPLMLLGAYDDLKPLTPKFKLAIQLFSAALFLAITALPFTSDANVSGFLDSAQPSFIHWTACLFWLLAIINSINLLDNMDGLSGGVSLIATMTIAILAMNNQQFASISYLYFVLAAAIAGFLVLNYNPAKLFMGDAGTLWLGLAVGAGALMVTSVNALNNTTNTAGYISFANFWLTPILICAIPITDTLMVMFTRKQRGQPVSVGGKDHLSHRLVSIGLSQRASVAALWLVSLLGSLLVLIVHSQPHTVWLIPVCVFFTALVASTVWLVQITSAPIVAAFNNTRV